MTMRLAARTHATYCHHHLKSSENYTGFLPPCARPRNVEEPAEVPGTYGSWLLHTAHCRHPRIVPVEYPSGSSSTKEEAEVFPTPISPKLTTLNLQPNTVYALCSTLQAQIHFFGCHGIFVKEITCAATDFHINDAFFVGKVIIHSRINDFQAESMLAAQKVDTGPSMQEVTDLLPSNLLRRKH